MNIQDHKKWIRWGLLGSVGLHLVGWLVFVPKIIGICQHPYTVDNVTKCRVPSIQEYVAGYVIALTAIAILFLMILHFLPRKVLVSWLRFSIPYWILATIIYLAEFTSSRGGGFFPQMDAGTLWFLLYIVIAVPLLIVKTYQYKK